MFTVTLSFTGGTQELERKILFRKILKQLHAIRDFFLSLISFGGISNILIARKSSSLVVLIPIVSIKVLQEGHRFLRCFFSVSEQLYLSVNIGALHNCCGKQKESVLQCSVYCNSEKSSSRFMRTSFMFSLRLKFLSIQGEPTGVQFLHCF